MAPRPRVFISYRRAETDGAAQLLYSQLTAVFGEDGVFMDQKGLLGGDDYRRRIVRELQGCDTMVVVIGAGWRGVSKHGAPSRLHEAEDYVRFEVGMALDRDLLVIPVLVNDAPRPTKQDLPDQLWRLTVYNDIRVRLNDRPGDAIARVCEAIKAKRKAGGPQRWLKPVAIAGGLLVVAAAAVLLWPKARGADGQLTSTGTAADSAATSSAPDTAKPRAATPAPPAATEPTARTQPATTPSNAGAADAGTTGESPACALDGVQFKQPGMGRDQLLFSEVDGGRRLQASGQLNGHTVSGLFAASGRALRAVERPGSTILAGQLALSKGCGTLSGSLTVRSMRSGGNVNVTVNLADPQKAD